MKMNFNYENNNSSKNTKGSGYYPQQLSLTEATIWFLVTAFVLFFSSAANM